MGKELYFTKLDTLRFVAFLLVFWSHAFSASFANIIDNKVIQTIIDSLTRTGGIGVQVFFVISGFLITFLMIREEKTSGKINVPFFYIRRILRIWPIYFLILIPGIFILPNLFDKFIFEGSIFKNLFFLNNFDMKSYNSANVGIAWSVAIEEQFYLVWPLIFYLLRNKKILLLFTVISFFSSVFFTILNPYTSYYHTFGNIRFLMAGSFGALVFSKYEDVFQNSFIMKPKNIYVAITFILLTIISIPFSKTIKHLSFSGLPLLFLYIVINLIMQGSKQKAGVFSKLGKYTYGMYLYHLMILIFVQIVFDYLNLDYVKNGYLNIIIAFVTLFMTIAISYISYEYFEKYFLSFKNRFSIIKTRI